ncbi:MAG: hypothetical protein OCU22_09930, partial [Canidatus Methanoxibalbensis ujae]|nr:hypothetical protein [Candidatus Methanoxibalbensis ujae]
TKSISFAESWIEKFIISLKCYAPNYKKLLASLTASIFFLTTHNSSSPSETILTAGKGWRVR